MSVNSARYEESSLIVLDEEVETPAAGWTINYASVNRVGALVAAHIEVAFAASAVATVLKLQPDFAPAQELTDPTGKFTLAADGTLSFTESTASAGTAVAQFVYQATV